MSTNLLTLIEQAGAAVIVPRDADRRALALHLDTLKAQGHAIVADEVYEDGELRGLLRILHYKGCRACQEKGGG